MALDIDKIRELAQMDDETIPPMTAQQAADMVRLLKVRPMGRPSSA